MPIVPTERGNELAGVEPHLGRSVVGGGDEMGPLPVEEDCVHCGGVALEDCFPRYDAGACYR